MMMPVIGIFKYPSSSLSIKKRQVKRPSNCGAYLVGDIIHQYSGLSDKNKVLFIKGLYKNKGNIFRAFQ